MQYRPYEEWKFGGRLSGVGLIPQAWARRRFDVQIGILEHLDWHIFVFNVAPLVIERMHNEDLIDPTRTFENPSSTQHNLWMDLPKLVLVVELVDREKFADPGVRTRHRDVIQIDHRHREILPGVTV